MWRNYWLCLSLANLVYLRAWSELGPFRSADLFSRKTVPGLNQYFAVAGDVLALSLLAFLVVRFAPNLPRWVSKALPVAALAAEQSAVGAQVSRGHGLRAE